MKKDKWLCTVLTIALIFTLPAFGAEFSAPLECQSAILMEASTGRVLFEKNADEPLPPASVTKIMTLLLVMEAVDAGKINLTDAVSVSENAASMGGSQVFLEPGETMCVEEMIKCVVIASANDCAVALAEHLYGSEAAFVAQMNTRAKELGMENTNFENTNGLDDTVTNHVTSARDIAIMSRELIAHPLILQYSSIWMDTIRGGSFGLTNTNRLVRFYSGANGLKTGSTAKAKFCISATAKREDMQLIAVIMAAPTRDIRNNEAKQLLDFGFANYGVFTSQGEEFAPLRIMGGTTDFCAVAREDVRIVLEKEKRKEVTQRIVLPQAVRAPIQKGEMLGKVIFEYNGETIAETDICATEDVGAIDFGGILWKIICGFCLG